MIKKKVKLTIMKKIVISHNITIHLIEIAAINFLP